MTTKSAADFPIGSTVWVCDGPDVFERIVANNLAGNSWGWNVLVLSEPVPLGGYNSPISNCFKTECEAVGESVVRRDEIVREAVQRLEAMKARLAELEGK
jgi:hypothetical protein